MLRDSHVVLLALGCLAVVVVTGVTGSSSNGPARQLLQRDNGCNCADQADPVCGVDGTTYTNQCQLQCVAGVELAYQGPCKGGNPVPAKPQPAPKTRTEPQLNAKPAAARPLPAKPAAAQPSCRCTGQLKAVCGSDGKTYDNECLALCKPGVVVAAAGGCISGAPVLPACSQPCPAQTSPVCGEDLRTYAGPCHAGCQGVKILARRACLPIDFSDDIEGRQQDTLEAAQVSASPGQPVSAVTPSSPNSHAAGCVCPEVYRPVCTNTGVTRSNACKAGCRGERVVAQGECEPQLAAAAAAGMAPQRQPDCVCAALYAPVCGQDGSTYSNSCEASCHAVAVASEGECGGQSAAAAAAVINEGCAACPDAYEPVCGANGLTYLNACKLRCEGKTSIAAQGTCKTDSQAGRSSQPRQQQQQQQSAGTVACLAKCTRDGKQACGLDGQTYANTCLAKCYNVEIAYPGACRADCAACPSAWNPYCIATSQFGPRTFANCCFAKCNGVNVLKQVLHPGGCRDSCKQCDQAKDSPVCCGGRTYKNGCYATCNREDAAKCRSGRCSSVAGVEEGLGCLLGPCPVKCSGYTYQQPVCGSDGKTYPDKCMLLCSQTTAVVAPGKCGVCAPSQPGGFPYCSPSDTQGLAPVCGRDGVTYRNAYAARQAGVDVASGGPCDKMCGEAGEACFPNGSSAGSTCCEGLRCSATAAAAAGGGGAPAVVQESSTAAAGVCIG